MFLKRRRLLYYDAQRCESAGRRAGRASSTVVSTARLLRLGLLLLSLRLPEPHAEHDAGRPHRLTPMSAVILLGLPRWLAVGGSRSGSAYIRGLVATLRPFVRYDAVQSTPG